MRGLGLPGDLVRGIAALKLKKVVILQVLDPVLTTSAGLEYQPCEARNLVWLAHFWEGGRPRSGAQETWWGEQMLFGQEQSFDSLLRMELRKKGVWELVGDSD